MPHDAHLSPVNSYDPGRDPAIGPLADVAVGSASGSLVDAAAGNATTNHSKEIERASM